MSLSLSTDEESQMAVLLYKDGELGKSRVLGYLVKPTGIRLMSSVLVKVNNGFPSTPTPLLESVGSCLILITP